VNNYVKEQEKQRHQHAASGMNEIKLWILS